MMYRFANGFAFTTSSGLSDRDIAEIRKDFKYGGISAEDAADQIRTWLSDKDCEPVEIDGESWTILRFGTEALRRQVAEGRVEETMPSDDAASWNLAASTVIREHNGHGWKEEYEAKRRRDHVAAYRDLTHDEWVQAKNSLQRLIAAGEGWRLDPDSEEAKGYEAMFGIMARAVWNAARYDNGRRLCIPSAEDISAEAEKIIRRWELRRMI